MEELATLKNHILGGRYTDALALVEELEGMSRKATLRAIRSYLLRLVVHLIKNDAEGRMTKSWSASIRGSVVEIQDLNLMDNRTGHYVHADGWDEVLETVWESALDEAALEVDGGRHSVEQLTAMVDRQAVLDRTRHLLSLTYTVPSRELPQRLREEITTLPGGTALEN